MPRVATCKDCSARFKVPDNTTATRAKCKKCGGVLEIPPAAEATQASPTAAPAKQTAPVKKAPAARKAPTASKAPAKKAASSRTASTKRASSARKTNDRKSSRKASKRAPRESDSKTGLIVGIAIVVIAVAGGGWWIFSGDDKPPAKEIAEAASTAEETQTSAPAAEKAPSPESSNNATLGEKAKEASLSTADSSSEESLKAKAPAKAPAKAKAPAAVAEAPQADPNEPLPTLIAFEDLPPTLGSTEDDLAEWTAMIKELYVDNFGGATGRRRKALLGKARELDPVLSVPAYINAVNGVDIGDEVFVIAMYNLVSDWQQSVGYIPTFSYPADTTRMDTKVQNLRVMVLNSWRDWWVNQRMAGQDQAKLDDYRILIERAVRPKEG